MDIAFTGTPFDRRECHREDPKLMEYFSADGSRIMLFAKDQIATDKDGIPVWYDGSDLSTLLVTNRVFLGVDSNDSRYFAAEIVNASPDDDLSALVENSPEGGKFRDARAIAMKLGAAALELGAIAQAKSLLSWHRRHKFCANCGAETKSVKGGAERHCDACGAHHFPRTDPVVIMLPRHDDHVLVGRGPKLPPGFYSALAGFIEGGESLEEAVVREVWEEAGLRVTGVHYIASQPWPWPSSLMLGCIADVSSQKVSLETDEIDSVHWLSRNDVRDILTAQRSDLFLPPPIAIARNLIDHWLNDANQDDSF